MTKLRDVINFIGAEPFQPFRVRTTDGRWFDVLYPDDAAAGISVMRVYSTINGDEDSEPQWHKIPLSLVDCIEPIQATNRLAN